ncbi:DUF488 domain-containing protein [Gilvimarinus sp. F26214L]|uniref:DUF488 domain-containing protein n=1 Tax=Gilvimarinus sp. DZF01 TaxID=3461371 RepID=UPI00404612A5
MSYDIRFKRVYEAAAKADGARVLVDRLWPRGKRKEELALTHWYRDAAPSRDLRRAWHQGDLDERTFARRYRKELDHNVEALIPLMRYVRKGRLTLLTAARDPRHSHLPVLQEALEAELDREDCEADGRDPSSPVCYEGRVHGRK